MTAILSEDIDAFFMYTVNVIQRVNETHDNIEIFSHNMIRNKNLLPFYVAVTQCPDEEGSHHYYQNLAAILAWHDKRIFLSILSDLIPSMIWQRLFNYRETPVSLTTPLDAAIHSRDPSLVQFVLNLPCLVEYAKSNPTEYDCLINDGITNACQWFEEPYTDAEGEIIESLQCTQCK